MSIREAILSLKLDDGITAAAGKITGTLSGIDGAVSRMNSEIRTTQKQLVGASAAFGVATAAILGPIRAAMDFENAMADVRKVVDFESPQAFRTLSNDVIELSRRLPMAASEIAALVAAAGQSGLENSELLEFAEMAAKVGVAWGVTADQAGESLAKLKTSLGLTVDETRLLADALNHLGNNSAAAAPDILAFTRRAAPMASAFGFSAEQAAGLGAAMIGAGFEAEVASTSFLNMGRALTAGASATGRQKDALAALGLEAEAVAHSMQVDAVGTINEIFAALREAPDHVRASVITDIFGSEARALTPLILNANLLADSLELVGDRAQFAGSAQAEYDERARTTSNALQLLRNQAVATGIAFGSALLPSIVDLSQSLGPVINRVTDFVSANQGLVRAAVAGTAAMLGLRVAFLGAKLGALLMGREILVATRGLVAFTAAAKTAAAAKLAAGLAGALKGMLGLTAATMALGPRGAAGLALQSAGKGVLGLLNPINLVRKAAIILRGALMFSGVGLAIAGIAAAATWVWNNLEGLAEFARGVGEGFMVAFAPVAPIFDPIISGVRDLSGWVSSLLGPVDASATEWRGWGVAVGEAIGGFATGAVEAAASIVQTFLGIPNALVELSSSIFDTGVAMVQSLWDGAAAKFWEFIDWVKSIPGQIIGAIGQINLSNVISWPAMPDWLGGPAPAPTPAPLATALPQIDGARADGGPVSSGNLYLVGEEGPELFSPGRSGEIISNNEMASGFGSTISIHAPVRVEVNGGQNLKPVDVQKAVEQGIEKMSDIIDRKLRRSARTAFTNVKYGDA